MAHTAKSLFLMNMRSSAECMDLYNGIVKLQTRLDTSWLLRSIIVFSISALDAYFHDKIRYKAGHIDLDDMPTNFAEFKIPISEIKRYEDATRKGNVQRDWLVNHFSIRPLQHKDDIKDAMRLIGYNDFWAEVEPNSPQREIILADLKSYVTRRNKIVHEGDRIQHRRGGKQLRAITVQYAQACIDYVTDLVDNIEAAFPGNS